MIMVGVSFFDSWDGWWVGDDKNWQVFVVVDQVLVDQILVQFGGFGCEVVGDVSDVVVSNWGYV